MYERLSRVTEASTSIERQDEAARAEVKRRGGRVVGAFVDEGVSGALPPMDRPAMKELLHQLSGMDAVMVWKIDRVARSFLGFAEIVKELDKYGVALVSATEPIDMTGPTGRAMAQMIAVFAELEREMIKARVADSMRKAKEENRFHGGRIPYGLTVADHPSGKGRVLVRDAHAVGVLREVLLWVLEGATMAQCARRLNDRKEPTSRQRGAVLKGLAKAEAAQWRGVSLKRILTSPTMLGYRSLPGGGVQTDSDALSVLVWDPVFSRDEWDALLTCLAELEQGPRKAPAASHWLSGCLKCTVCGGNLKQWVSGAGCGRSPAEARRVRRTLRRSTFRRSWWRTGFENSFLRFTASCRRWSGDGSLAVMRPVSCPRSGLPSGGSGTTGTWACSTTMRTTIGGGWPVWWSAGRFFRRSLRSSLIGRSNAPGVPLPRCGPVCAGRHGGVSDRIPPWEAPPTSFALDVTLRPPVVRRR